MSDINRVQSEKESRRSSILTSHLPQKPATVRKLVRYRTANAIKALRESLGLKPSSSDTDPDCPFCWENVKLKIVENFNSVFAIKDENPVTKHHALILPKRHTHDYFSMTENEKRDADSLIGLLRKRISEADPSVTGFNIGMNSGESAGQTIFHAHIHLIPRRDGDTPNPKGGVRGVIPDKMGY